MAMVSIFNGDVDGTESQTFQVLLATQTSYAMLLSSQTLPMYNNRACHENVAFVYR